MLSVIAAHAGLPAAPGGFVGVDIFFVISGYVITRSIRHESRVGTFSLPQFYARRALRIIPTLFLVMLVCLPPAWYWMLPNSLKNFGQSVTASTLFANNVLLAATTGYWDLESDFKPLLHTWSFAVEIQIYLVFPLLLLGLRRATDTRLAATLATLAIASFVSFWLGPIPSRHHLLSSDEPLLGVPGRLALRPGGGPTGEGRRRAAVPRGLRADRRRGAARATRGPPSCRDGRGRGLRRGPACPVRRRPDLRRPAPVQPTRRRARRDQLQLVSVASARAGLRAAAQCGTAADGDAPGPRRRPAAPELSVLALRRTTLAKHTGRAGLGTGPERPGPRRPLRCHRHDAAPHARRAGPVLSGIDPGDLHISYNERIRRYAADAFGHDGRPRLLVVGNSLARDVANAVIESGFADGKTLLYREDTAGFCRGPGPDATRHVSWTRRTTSSWPESHPHARPSW